MRWCAPAALRRKPKTQSCVSVTEGVFTTSEVSQGRSATANECLFVCLSNIWTSAAETLQDGRTSAGQLRWQVEHKEHRQGREEDKEQGRGGQREGRERGEGKRRGDHDCHVVRYSICCIAAQSGGEGGGQASLHRRWGR